MGMQAFAERAGKDSSTTRESSATVSAVIVLIG
jgi:hypothetical protein